MTELTRQIAEASGLTNLEVITESHIAGYTRIGFRAFSGCSSLTSITIPNSVDSIGNGAFAGCSSLTSITIPEGVTSIGEGAFYGCSSLTSIIIPEGVTSIGQQAFVDCRSLTSITMPEGVTSIGSEAFDDCSSLTSIKIPEGVTSIGDMAFLGCQNLKLLVSDLSKEYLGEKELRSDCRVITHEQAKKLPELAFKSMCKRREETEGKVEIPIDIIRKEISEYAEANPELAQFNMASALLSPPIRNGPSKEKDQKHGK